MEGFSIGAKRFLCCQVKVGVSPGMRLRLVQNLGRFALESTLAFMFRLELRFRLEDGNCMAACDWLGGAPCEVR